MGILSNIRTAYANDRAEKMRLAQKKAYIADFNINGASCVIKRCQNEVETYIEGYCSGELIFSASYGYDPSHQLGLCIEHLIKNSPYYYYERKEPHGKWLKTEAYPHRVYCSICYKSYVTNEEVIEGRGNVQHFAYCTEAEYCPHCGSKMDL